MERDVSGLVRDALVLCADGGIHRAQQMGVAVDIFIGDGDSVQNNAPVCSCATMIQLPTQKDETDTMACVQYALQQGYQELHLLCCTGGRIDHFLSNLFILEYCANRNAVAMLHDDWNEISFLAAGTYEIDRDDRYPYLSIVAIDEMVQGVTLEGLKYPLENGTLRREFALGVSNEFIDKIARITIGNGRCLLIRSRDR